MVDVGMRHQDLLELESQLGEALGYAAHLVARIDDDGLARLFIAQNRAVASQRTDGKRLEDHGFILGGVGGVSGARQGLVNLQPSQSCIRAWL